LITVALANIVRGVPINADMQFTGNLLTLLNPYALLAGVFVVLVFTLYGATFLALKSRGEIEEKAQKVARRLWVIVVVFMLGFLVATYFATDIVEQLGVNPGVVPLTGVVTILITGYFLRQRMNGWAFASIAISIAVVVITLFMILYPRVIVSSLNEIWSLDIYNASSSDYTLKVMTVVAIIFIPIVLIYQGWSYWVFRKRLTQDSHLEY